MTGFNEPAVQTWRDQAQLHRISQVSAWTEIEEMPGKLAVVGILNLQPDGRQEAHGIPGPTGYTDANPASRPIAPDWVSSGCRRSWNVAERHFSRTEPEYRPSATPEVDSWAGTGLATALDPLQVWLAFRSFIESPALRRLRECICNPHANSMTCPGCLCQSCAETAGRRRHSDQTHSDSQAELPSNATALGKVTQRISE